MKTYDVILFTDMTARFWHAKTLGAYRLASELRSHGYSTKVVDWFGKWLENPTELFKLLSLIVGPNTLFIGFSSTFLIQYESTGNIINDWESYSSTKVLPQDWPIPNNKMDIVLAGIRKKYPHVKLVIGGSKDFTSVMKSVDFIIKGLADSTIIELASHLKNNTSLKFMPSGKRAKIIDHDTKAVSFNFKQAQTQYHESDHIVPGEFMPLETSRGCLFKCSFCDYPLIGRKKGDPDYHKIVDTMAQEFRSNYENFGINRYMFVDDTFNETTKKIEEVIQARDASGVDIEFACYLRADLLARFPEQLPLLKNLGIFSAFLGIESLYKPSAASVGKSTDPERIKETIYMMKDQCPDLRIEGSFIVGLPEDNPETLNTWVPWLLQKNNPIDMYRLRVLNINNMFEGSDIERNPEKFGYIVDPRTKYWKNKFWDKDAAAEYAAEVMQLSWESNRLKLAAYDQLGIKNYPGVYEKFKDLPINQLDFNLLAEHKETQWKNYRDIVFAYESQ